MIEEINDAPNLTMESHFDYGPRAGYWRVVRVLEKYSAKCTANVCAEAVQLYPALGRDLVERGFEVSCHGRRWETPLGLSEEEERRWIAESVAAIDQMMKKFMDESFNKMRSAESAYELLQKFRQIQAHEASARLMERKTVDILLQYEKEVAHVQQMFDDGQEAQARLALSVLRLRLPVLGEG